MKNTLFFSILLLLASCQKCEEQPTPERVNGPSVGLTLDGARIVMLPWKVDSMSNGRVDCHYKDAQSQIIMLCVFKDNILYTEPNGFYKEQSFIIHYQQTIPYMEICGSDVRHDDLNLSIVW